MKSFYVPAKEIRWLTDKAFSTRKRKVRISVEERVCFSNTFWDGGSRNQYKAVKLEDGSTASLLVGGSPWTAIAEGKSLDLEPGICIVEDTVFCGKDMCLTVHIHPSNLTPALEAAKIAEKE